MRIIIADAPLDARRRRRRFRDFFRDSAGWRARSTLYHKQCSKINRYVRRFYTQYSIAVYYYYIALCHNIRRGIYACSDWRLKTVKTVRAYRYVNNIVITQYNKHLQRVSSMGYIIIIILSSKTIGSRWTWTWVIIIYTVYLYIVKCHRPSYLRTRANNYIIRGHRKSIFTAFWHTL